MKRGFQGVNNFGATSFLFLADFAMFLSYSSVRVPVCVQRSNFPCRGSESAICVIDTFSIDINATSAMFIFDFSANRRRRLTVLIDNCDPGGRERIDKDTRRKRYVDVTYDRCKRKSNARVDTIVAFFNRACSIRDNCRY